MGLKEVFRNKLSSLGTWINKIREDGDVDLVLKVGAGLSFIAAIWIEEYVLQFLFTAAFLHFIRPKPTKEAGE